MVSKVVDLKPLQLLRNVLREQTQHCREMKYKITTLIVVFGLTFAIQIDAKFKERCSTLSCVHSSATIIQKLNTEVDPCDDFYEYACGTFLQEQHTPDEKSTVDTIALMDAKLTEYLLTLLLKPSQEGDPKLHKLAKTFFASCQNFRN